MVGWLLLAGLLLVGVSVPLAARKIGPNRLYGFRTPRTLKDERVWYPVNRMVGRNGIVMGLLIMAIAMGLGFGVLGAMVGTGLLALAVVVGLISTMVSAASIVQRIDQGGPLIDYRSSFDKTRSRNAKSAREKLFEKLK